MQINNRVIDFESPGGLGNRLNGMVVTIQNLTQCMANLNDSKQAVGAPGPVAQGCNSVNTSYFVITCVSHWKTVRAFI